VVYPHAADKDSENPLDGFSGCGASLLSVWRAPHQPLRPDRPAHEHGRYGQPAFRRGAALL
ncbi:MAG: hypothetical protein AVDCRST_MAG87-2213, partial [uncultured Thermomicrobiales bacterium]